MYVGAGAAVYSVQCVPETSNASTVTVMNIMNTNNVCYTLSRFSSNIGNDCQFKKRGRGSSLLD